jgi:hypothetical protein
MTDDSDLIQTLDDGAELRREIVEREASDDDHERVFIRYPDGHEQDVYSSMKVGGVWSYKLKPDDS